MSITFAWKSDVRHRSSTLAVKGLKRIWPGKQPDTEHVRLRSYTTRGFHAIVIDDEGIRRSRPSIAANSIQFAYGTA